MAHFQHQIQQFLGIQQQYDGSLMTAGSAHDARNMDTTDGNLAVAKGYQKAILNGIMLGTGERVLKLIVSRGITPVFFVVTTAKIYYYKESNATWVTIYTFSPALVYSQVDYVQTHIGMTEYLVIANGQTQMLKINLGDYSVSLFGTGDTTYEGKVSAFDSGTLIVTLNSDMDATAQDYVRFRGIHINDTWYEVKSAPSSTTVELYELADALHPPVVGDDVVIDGGCSSAACNYVGTFYSRMFAAGDPNAPCRLYWSAATGSGRTFEDWASVESAADASGGYVEVGDSDGDIIIGIARLSSQLIIFKRHSVYRFYGDRPSTFTLERIENFSEEMSNAGCVVKYDAPYFMTKTGMKTYDGTGVIPMNDGVRMIRRYLETVNTFVFSKGIHCDNKLYFSCRTASSGYDDAIVVYDMARQSYMIRDGFTVADLTAFDGVIYLINTQELEGVNFAYVNQFDVGDTYDGEPINAYWETQHTDLGAKQYRKQIARLYMRGGGDGEFALTIFADRNKEEKHYRWTEVTDGDLLIVPYKVDRATSFWLRLENEQGSHFHIDGGIDINYERELQG